MVEDVKQDSDIAPDKMTVNEAGRRGGNATRDRAVGTDFYRKIGQKGGKKTAELYRNLLPEFGKRGGRPRMRQKRR